VGGCVLVYARTHTQTTWVLDVSPGVGRTPGEPEGSRSTKAQYTCRPYMCTKYICLFICWGSGFDDLHLESSKQNYYIISLWAIIKATFIGVCWDNSFMPYLPELEYLIENPCHGLFSKKKTPGGFDCSNLSEVNFVGRDFPDEFTRITWKSKQNLEMCLFLETRWWKKLWESGSKLILLLALAFGRRTHWLGDFSGPLLGLPMKIPGFYDFFCT